MRSHIRRDSNFRSENCIHYTVLPLEMWISLSGTSSVIIKALCVTLGQEINVKEDWINDLELIHIHMIILT
jgi:diacylglycerol kinase